MNQEIVLWTTLCQTNWLKQQIDQAHYLGIKIYKFTNTKAQNKHQY